MPQITDDEREPEASSDASDHYRAG